MSSDRRTIVSFHAHPDDEALLTGGTLAKASAAGHRVVLVTATNGERGMAATADGTGTQLATARARELDEAAGELGAVRVVRLGYGDSGLYGSDDDTAFMNADVDEAAHRLARILVEEDADVLTIYDARGGYGHPDHIQVHRVGSRAARLAHTPIVLEATVDADLFKRVMTLLRLLRNPLGRSAPLETRAIFTRRSRLTHRVDVSAHIVAKRRAMAAHATQQRADGEVRVLARLLRLPPPLFRMVFGREWFVEQGRRPRRPLEDDIFATTRRQATMTERA